MTVAPVLAVLEHLRAPHALIGAYAMAARGYARFTADLDIFTTDRRVLDDDVWVNLAAEGAVVVVRRGDSDDPLAGVVHLQLPDGSDIDVIAGRWPWETRLIERTEPMSVLGTIIRVPSTADLILLKLAAGGFVDRQDAAALLTIGPRDRIVREVEAHLAEVCPDVTALWREILSSTP